MRRNLRLDWRALALLGALLSIIIDWPGLVYAMPTILPPVAATATAEALPIDILNTIKNDKTVSFLNDQPDSNKRFATMTPSLKQDIDIKLTQQQQQQQPPLQPILQRITTTNEKLKQQVNDNQNSIRKQQQITNKKQEPETIYEGKFKVPTAIHKEVEGEENSSAIPLAAANLLESLPKVTSLLKNTHTKNSTNTNTENNTFKSTTTLSTATTTTPPTTTESLVSIPSTLMSTNVVETEAQAPPQHNHQHHNQKQEQFETSFKFSSSHHLAILSRTERSIRSSSSASLSPSALKSVGSSSNVSSSSSSSRSGSRISSASSVVRRSSDMSVLKSKRLNNSRNLHQKNNLDRNERSTVSHLSGPSRKIQLYIKNRFIQLLPDGTVNGTQDEQCDYSEYKISFIPSFLFFCMII